MRLIDAEAIHYKWVNGIIGVESTDIKKMPTVEAIPVDWIRKKYPLSGVYGTEDYFRKAYAIYEVLKEWEQDDETD